MPPVQRPLANAVGGSNAAVTAFNPSMLKMGGLHLFVTKMGDAFHANAMSKLVKDYVNLADIGIKGSCHLFRHTCATLMLEGGADVRYIQTLLGYAKLETTGIYTQVSIKQLKDVHTLAHPTKIEKSNGNL